MRRCRSAAAARAAARASRDRRSSSPASTRARGVASHRSRAAARARPLPSRTTTGPACGQGSSRLRHEPEFHAREVHGGGFRPTQAPLQRPTWKTETRTRAALQSQQLEAPAVLARQAFERVARIARANATCRRHCRSAAPRASSSTSRGASPPSSNSQVNRSPPPRSWRL